MSVASDDLRGGRDHHGGRVHAHRQVQGDSLPNPPPPARAANPIPQSERKKPPQTLSTVERAAALAASNTGPNADLSIRQVWARELDDGRYWCSLSSMYRIARAAGQVRDRRAPATHPAKIKPELLASGPSRAWSWDITKLRGPTRGVWFHLYVLIDIYSRFTPGWIVAAREDSMLAKDFLDEAIARNGACPHTVHANRGTSMTPKPASALLVDLGVTRSHSRPRVFNDNPYSEAQFKTMKYLHDFPGTFNTVYDARAFCKGFFAEYNHIHRHCGIGWHTPASVHFGTADAIDDARQFTLDAAYAAHPERFARRPLTPKIPQQSWINRPAPERQNT